MRKMKASVGPFKQGATIFKSKPFAFILPSKLSNTRCDNCLQSGKLFKCSACQYVYYCDRNCQRESWSIHKAECANLRRVSPKVVPDVARLMARVIVKLNQGGADEVGYYTDTSFRRFKDLMSHYSDLKKDEKRMEHFICLCVVLFEFLGDIPVPNTAELMGIYGRICINSFNILDPDMSIIGVGIYLGPSVLDHSCKPNVVPVFEGTTMIVKALEDIPCLDWSQMRISYIDVLRSEKDRRAELKSAYYFWCDCERCVKPEPLAEAATCPNESCRHACYPFHDKCLKCGAKFPEGFEAEFDEVAEFTEYHLETMKNMAYLDVSRVCLKKQSGILHPLNVQRVRTLEAAYQGAINLECWEDAELYAKELLPGYLLYYGEMYPQTGSLYMMLGKIQLYLGKSKQALEAFRKASSILAITHGERHTLVRETLKPLLQRATLEAQ